MTIAFDTVTTSNSGNNVSSLTFSYTTSSGLSNSILLVDSHTWYASLSISSLSSVTYGGNSCTSIGVTGTNNNSDDFLAGMHYKLAPTAGAANVVITAGSTQFSITGAARVYTGVDQTTPIGTAVTNKSNSSTNPTVTVSSATGELVVDCLSTAGSQNDTPDVSQTSRYAATVNTLRSRGSDKPGASSITMNWSLDNARAYAIVAVPLKPASGGGGGITLAQLERKHRGSFRGNL
jgi:hypothetical protein